MKSTIDRIAREILGLETLERRNRDSLDFHDLAVWQIEDALKAAYLAGARSKDLELRMSIALLVEASDGLLAAIDRANQEYDTGALDIIEPLRSSLQKALAMLSTPLKGGAA
jgi:hypothetical protein